MEIIVKKNIDMTLQEKIQICDLFKDVFGIEKKYSDFIHQFEKNEFGYSYFGLVYDDIKLVGSYAVIPFKFIYHNEEVVFGQSVDTMIDEGYRGNPFLLKKLADKVYKQLKEDSIPFVFGFPNDNIYLVRKKILQWQDIYNLDIHLLPVNITAVSKILKPFGFIYKIMLKVLNSFLKGDVDMKEKFKIYKNRSSVFNEYRFIKDYHQIDLSENAYSFYKIKEFNNVKTAFIVDVFPLTKVNIELTVSKIYQLEKQIDLIAYFGSLNFSPINLFKVPEKYKPKNTFMSGKILDESKISRDIYDIKQWRVNLSNFDWI